MLIKTKMLFAVSIAVMAFALLSDLPLPGTILQTNTAFAQSSLQLLTTDTDLDGKIESATLSWPDAYQLGGGLGQNCGYSDFGYLNCTPGPTCEIPLSWVPTGYSGDVYVWMWGYSTPGATFTSDCQIVRVDDFVGPTPPSVVGVQTYGATYGELSARWWQWLLSIPAAVNPNLDTTGANCALGQYDDVWFLAGVFGGTVERTCTIPAGKPIFCPLINTIAFKPRGNETILDLRRQAAAFIDSVSALDCTMDDTACFKDRSSFRVKSPSFTVIAPAKGLVPPGKLSVPGNTDSLVSDGYWLLIDPPKPGTHIIKFKATTTSGFSLDVTYNLTVQ